MSALQQQSKEHFPAQHPELLATTLSVTYVLRFPFPENKTEVGWGEGIHSQVTAEIWGCVKLAAAAAPQLRQPGPRAAVVLPLRRIEHITRGYLL